MSYQDRCAIRALTKEVRKLREEVALLRAGGVQHHHYQHPPYWPSVWPYTTQLPQPYQNLPYYGQQ